MKKIMITAAVVCACALAQAAQVSWQIQAGPTFTGTGLTDHNNLAFSGTGYLILASDIGAAKTALAKDGTLTGVTTYGENTNWSSFTGGMDAGVASANTLSAEKALSFAIVLIQDEGEDIWYKVSTGSAEVKPSTDLINNPADVMFDSTTHFASDWSSYSAVPEPTSGLLLLLGVAGLALKRRRV